ncbi:hypothetical protein BGX27_002000 [Mortierella sp. AM989]|nr:hypothetical protein BGX27_002000 [Mortierella sp. AM989]
MALCFVPSYDGSLADNCPSESTQLESFPPLYITRSDVLNPDSLKLEHSPPTPSDQGKEGGAKRWLILFLSCLLLFGNYFGYDNPAALNTQLQKYLGMPYNEYQYLLSTLYSIYSLPNTVLPFLCGSLIDRLGPRRVLLVLSGCVCLGQAIFSIGVQTRRVWLMLLGRAIFGIGGESCGVAQASITTMHFRGHELAFALGLNLCIARFGSVVNTIVTPWAEQKWDVPTAIWIGTLSCVVSFISAVCLVSLIDEPGTTTSGEEDVVQESTPLPLADTETTANDINNQVYLALPISAEDDLNVDSPPQPPIIQHLPGILRHKTSFAGSINSVRFTPGIPKSGTRPSLHIMTDHSRKQETWWSQWWSDLKFFPSTFWLLCTLTVLLYGTAVPFNNIASDFLQSKWYHNNPRKAAAVMGIPDTMGAILVPGFGIIVDRYGRRASTLILSSFIMVIVHTTLGFTMLNPIFALSLLGIAYSLNGVALWPSIACVVTNELHLGKGYGISTSFLNISLTVVPPIVATIRVVSNSFLPVEMFFILMGLCGILVGFIIKAIDHRDGGALEAPEIQVEIPVIVPQVSCSTSNSRVASPAMSQKRSKERRRPKLPALDVRRRSASDSEGMIMRNQEDYDGDDDPNSLLLRRIFQRGGEAADGSPWNTSIISSPLARTRSSSSIGSSVSERTSRNRPWFSRPLLQRTMTRIGSPLLQQYSSSPRYGSISSPSISISMRDDFWDIEDGTNAISRTEGYSVSQHPILYNPLRGSSGSFRISRSARPIAFGEGEEGRIFVDGEPIEPRHEVHDSALDVDSEHEDMIQIEQSHAVIANKEIGHEDMTTAFTSSDEDAKPHS